MKKELQNLRNKALKELARVKDLSAVEAWRVAYLGRKGTLTQLLRSVGQLSAKERPKVGELGNRIKEELQTALQARIQELEKEAQKVREAETLDITLPGRRPPQGGLHPVTRTLNEIIEIFTPLGFSVYEGPEVEWDRYNFELLNIPPDHPARDMWDTLYIAPPYGKGQDMLLRTHTSPGQIRLMQEMAPAPLRVLIPGRCYRYEAVDPTHEWMFVQVEGLAVGKKITMADLKGVLSHFARQMFGEELKVRFRCDYFPFVEPGAEMAIECFVCHGPGCRTCKYTGWIEILGAGMVHPQVLRNGGYDPAEFSGFAFGMGVERIAMLKYGIEDIRYFYGNDLRFLSQFR
ncbi:MAG: phenylalanine--tRNA ligase subunit alpha [Chloroflexi bacterium]|nr:phenylalanine--tRNA ligase subunit alpha [Chloroflexota bacterium]